MDRGFRSDNKQTKEEFLSQFENTSEEITIITLSAAIFAAS